MEHQISKCRRVSKCKRRGRGQIMSEFINNNEVMITKINEIISTKKNCTISIVNDKLTLSVFSILSKNLKNVKEINLILRSQSASKPQEEREREFEIDTIDIREALFNSYDIRQKNTLAHFERAKSMYDFIKSHVSIKRVKPGFSVKGNILIIDEEFMVNGSSSLEMTMHKSKDINFDTMILGNMDVEQIRGMKNAFESLWYDGEKTENFKNEVLESLSYVFKDHSPEFMYYFTLNELFGSQIDLSVEKLDKDVYFKSSKVWNALYNFQKDCVVSAIKKLNKYGGCIIADSVGLGKTFEALAIIKYYELRMDRVLVLTPAKLYDNWDSFRGTYMDNALGEDFNYKIMFHTDLNRIKGMSKSGQDLSRFDWSRYDLVVIDESHNFRNRTEKDIDEEGFTRYQRLLNDVIINKQRTRVLLLSATPVNNSLVDLKNQISLITRDNDEAFKEEGIPSIANALRVTSSIINSWDKVQNKSKTELFDNLPPDFYRILELLTIARSRKHITTYFKMDEVGKFPDKLKPDTYTPDIDKQHELLKIEDTNELLECLKLAVYTPMHYIKSEFKQLYRDKYKTVHKGKDIFFQEDRELYSKGMHRFNLFKRLESSIFAFGETIRRLLEKIENNLAIMERGAELEFTDEGCEDGESLDYKLDIKIAHLRKADYIEDLKYDQEILNAVYNNISKILNNKRDEKLEVLRNILRKKINETPYNQGNKKVIVFTAFADTASYLFLQLKELFDELDIAGAVLIGSGNPQVHNIKMAKPDFNGVLRAFSPRSKKVVDIKQEISVLIGTDCISEGQNLQDCDCVINYDINWNPVTLIQRFGRIDRIGSSNKQIKMVLFYPNMELNEYLNLEKRVKSKMILSNLASTGGEDFLNPELNDIDFRKNILEKLKNEVIDIDEAKDSISLTDLNMNEYLYELSQYISSNKEISQTPRGIFSITGGGEKAGVIFCFKHSYNAGKPQKDSSLYPYYLIYVDNTGAIKVGNDNPRALLKIYRSLAMGRSTVNKELVDEMMKETKNMQEMKFYSDLLTKAINSIQGNESKKAEQTIFDFGGYKNEFEYSILDDFELISFLVVR